MAEFVVDVFEVVDVEDGQREWLAIAADVADLALDKLTQHVAAVQTGQRVVEGDVFQLSVDRLRDVDDALDDVPD